MAVTIHPRSALLGSLLAAASSLTPGCSSPSGSGEALFTVDLRQAERGEIPVRLEVSGQKGRPLSLSSFVQPEVLRVESLGAREGNAPIPVRRVLDAKGFGRWLIGPPQATGTITVDYVVRPGAREEAKMSGPTGYVFGHLDRAFGLLGGRQIFLLGMDPGPPRRIRVDVLLPPGRDIVTPWPAAGAAGAFELTGSDAAAQLLQAVIGVGPFDMRSSKRGSFRVWVSNELPVSLRATALGRALALEEDLASRIGRPARRYDLILVPKTQDGFLVSVTPGPAGLGLSLDAGLPTRWLSIGRDIGQAYLADRLRALGGSSENRWVLEALPTYFTVEFSERDGWRSRQDWYEQFYYESAGLAIDLAHWAEGSEQLKEEWRGALVLDLLSRELSRRGLPTIGELCGKTLGQGRALDWGRFVSRVLPPDLRLKLEAWLAPAPSPFSFPGSDETDAPLRLVPPPPRPAATGRRDAIDLYLGGRTFGLLEQCGCRSRQMGGMGRRTTVLRQRLKTARPSLALELGDAIPHQQLSPMLDRQKTVESDLALSLLSYSGTSASVVGYAELAYGPRFLSERAAGLPHGFRLLSANVRGPGLNLSSIMERKVGPRPVRIVGVLDPASYRLGRALEFEDATAGVTVESPAAALKKLLEDHPTPELTIVMGPLGPSAVFEIHRTLPDLPLIVTDSYFRFGEDPRLAFERPPGQGLATFGMLGKTLLVVLQSDSYGLVRLGLSLGRDGAIVGAELEDIELGDDIPDDPVVRTRLDNHYAALTAESGLTDLPPIGRWLRDKLDASYVGAAACAPCHPQETDQWKGTSHAEAFATLLNRRRQGVPGCFACHVTGYRQPTGYRKIADVSLRHVQCESCHGPGSRHVAAPGKDSIIRVPVALVCLECHNEKHSDMNDSNFTDYWSRVVHTSAPPPDGEPMTSRQPGSQGFEKPVPPTSPRP